MAADLSAFIKSKLKKFEANVTQNASQLASQAINHFSQPVKPVTNLQPLVRPQQIPQPVRQLVSNFNQPITAPGIGQGREYVKQNFPNSPLLVSKPQDFLPKGLSNIGTMMSNQPRRELPLNASTLDYARFLNESPATSLAMGGINNPAKSAVKALKSKIAPELERLAKEAKKYKNAEEFTDYYVKNQNKIQKSPEYIKYLKEKEDFVKREEAIYAEMGAMRNKYAGKTINEVPAEDIAKYDNLQKEINQVLSKKTLAPVPEGTIKTIDHIGEKGFRNQLADIYTQATKTTPAVRQSSVVGGGAPSKVRGFVNTVKNAKITAPQVKAGVKGTYTPITNKETLNSAQKLINTNLDEAIRRVKGPEPADAETFTIAQDLVRRYQNKGRYQEAIEIVETVARKATTQGQAIQALSMWNRLSPEGALRYSQTLIQRANAGKTGKLLTIAPEKAKQITDLAKSLQKLPEGREKALRTAELVEEVHSVVPPSLLQKISTIQTMAQLLNPKTAIRNIVGNVGFMAGENVSQVVGTPIDIATSLFTGKRTTTLPSVGAQAKGFGLGLKEGLEEALRGVDTRGLPTQFDIPRTRIFKAPVLKQLETAMNVELRATDRAFYRAALDESLDNQMRLAKVAQPTDEMLEAAHHQALYRTFQDENVATRLFTGMKRALNLNKDFGLGDIVIKYPRTPASLLMRGVDYSPAGFVRTIYEAAAPLMGKGFNQKAFVDSFSRAIVGSGGLMATGAMLHKLGIITGKPEKDKDIRETERSIGLGGYRINTSALKRLVLSGMDAKAAEAQAGDHLISYDWFQPFAIALSMGANIDENGGKAVGMVDTLLASLQGGVETLADQPLVRGVRQISQGYSPVDALVETVKGVPASFVPTLASQVNQLGDNTTRNTYNPSDLGESLNMAKAKIPGLAQSLPPKYDVFGKEQERFQDGSNTPFNVFLSPAFVSTLKDDPVANEVLDIFDQSGETQQAPRVAPKKVTVNGESLTLTGEQQSQYQQFIGSKTREVYESLLQQPQFAALSDTEKAKKMASYLTDINSLAKVELFGGDPKNLSGNAKRIQTGETVQIVKQPGVTKLQTKKTTTKIAKPKKPKKPKLSIGKVGKLKAIKIKTPKLRVSKPKKIKLKVIKAPKVANYKLKKRH